MDNVKQDKDARIEALIHNNLKLCYPELADEPLPDRFKDLLDVLKAQEAERQKS